MDLKEFLKQKPFETLHTSIGTLWLFSISYGDQTELESKFTEGIDSIDPNKLIREMVKYTAFPESSLPEDRVKPDKAVLNEEDVGKLSEKELERFAELYVTANPYLLRKSEYNKKKADDGSVVPKNYLGEIEHEKHDNETYLSYLTRLWVIQRDKHLKHREQLLNQFRGFSKGLSDSIQANILHGDSLQRAIDSVRPDLPTLERRPFDFAETHRLAEEARLRPFEELGDKLEQLIGLSVQAIDFSVESNSIQTRVASELKLSGESSNTFSRRNIFLSISIIVLTVIGLWMASYNSRTATQQIENAVEGAEIAIGGFQEQIDRAIMVTSEDQVATRELLQLQNEALQELLLIQRESTDLTQSLQSQLFDLQQENSTLQSEVNQLNDRLRLIENEDN